MYSHTKSPTHQVTHTPSHPHTKSPTHQVTHTPSHSHTKSPTHQVTLTPSHPHTKSPTHQVTHTPSQQHTPSHPHTKSPTHTMSPTHQVTHTPSHQHTPTHHVTHTIFRQGVTTTLLLPDNHTSCPQERRLFGIPTTLQQIHTLCQAVFLCIDYGWIPTVYIHVHSIFPHSHVP